MRQPAWARKRVRKFQRGERHASVRDAIHDILTGNYVWWRHKAVHPGFMVSLQLHVIMQAYAKGQLYRADLTPEYMAQEMEMAECGL